MTTLALQCPTCASRMRVTEAAAKGCLKCPKCKSPMSVSDRVPTASPSPISKPAATTDGKRRLGATANRIGKIGPFFRYSLRLLNENRTRVSWAAGLASVSIVLSVLWLSARSHRLETEEMVLSGIDATDERLLALANDYPNLESLRLAGRNIDDSTLEHLTGLAHLKTLDLTGTAITDAGLDTISLLETLRTLKLTRTEITDDGLLPLRGLPNLRHIDLTYTRITDTGLALLGGFPDLRSARYYGTRVSGAAVARLQAKLSQTK